MISLPTGWGAERADWSWRRGSGWSWIPVLSEGPLTRPLRPVHKPRAKVGVACWLRGAVPTRLPRRKVFSWVWGWRRTLHQGPLAPPVIGKPVVDLLRGQAHLRGQVLLPQNNPPLAQPTPKPRGWGTKGASHHPANGHSQPGGLQAAGKPDPPKVPPNHSPSARPCQIILATTNPATRHLSDVNWHHWPQCPALGEPS